MPLSDWLRLGGSFAASYASYMMDGDPHLFSATFFVTHRCNIRCSYCYFPKQPVAEMTVQEIETVFSRLRRQGATRLSLTGGEPLVRPDLDAIIGAAKRLGFFVTVNSSLLLYPERGRLLDSADLVFASLDGDKAAHEAQRGPGSFDGVIDSMKDLLRRGKRVVAICVVTPGNHGSIPFMLELAERMGIRVHFHPQCVHPIYHEDPPRDEPSSEDAREIWRGLIDQKRKGRPIATSLPYLECLAQWKDFDVVAYRDPAQKCAAGRGFVFVEPNGDAYSCIYRKEALRPVNLLREDWKAPDELPCSVCRAGPLLEMRMLFNRPLRTAGGLFGSYLRPSTRP